MVLTGLEKITLHKSVVPLLQTPDVRTSEGFRFEKLDKESNFVGMGQYFEGYGKYHEGEALRLLYVHLCSPREVSAQQSKDLSAAWSNCLYFPDLEIQYTIAIDSKCKSKRLAIFERQRLNNVRILLCRHLNDFNWNLVRMGAEENMR